MIRVITKKTNEDRRNDQPLKTVLNISSLPSNDLVRRKIVQKKIGSRRLGEEELHAIPPNPFSFLLQKRPKKVIPFKSPLSECF